MIKKSLVLPEPHYRTYRFSANELRKGALVKSARLSGVKETEGGLTLAEGREEVYELTYLPARIYCTENEVFAYENRRMHYLSTEVRRTGFNPVNRLLAGKMRDSSPVLLAVATSRTYQLKENSAANVSVTDGGACAVFHHERLFLGGGESGTRLSYSAPFAFERLSDKTTQNAGYIDLPPDGRGAILEMVSFGDKLYLFRERGVSVLTAYADTLNFRLTHLRYGCGKILAESVARCGDGVYFFTERGFFSFNGADFAQIADGDAEGIDLSKPVWAVSAQGEYFASVFTGGKRIVYSYQPAYRRGRYLAVENDMIAGCDSLWYVKESTVGKIETGAAEACGASIEVRVAFPQSKNAAVYAEEIKTTGEGEYAVSLAGEDGAFVNAVKRGKGYYFPRAVRGEEFTLRLLPKGEFRLESLEIGTRRDEQ